MSRAGLVCEPAILSYGVILGLDPGIQRTKRMQPAVFWIPAFAGMTVLGEGNVIMRIAVCGLAGTPV